MATRPHFILIAAGVLALAGCATGHAPAAGTHLVYRDSKGTPTMQVDYASSDMCHRVEAISEGAARCEDVSQAAHLHARATLWYNPGDFTVQAYYTDVASCERVNSRMAPGVHLEHPCSAQ